MQFLEARQISKSIGRHKGPRQCINLHINGERRSAGAVMCCRCGWQSGAVHDAICASPLRPVFLSPHPSSGPVSSSSRSRRRRAACARAVNNGGRMAGSSLGESWTTGGGRRVEGLSRSASCIDPARSRTRLLPLFLFSLFLDNCFLLFLSTSPFVSLSLPPSPSSLPSFSLSYSLSRSLSSFLPCTPIIGEPFRRKHGLSASWRARFRASGSLFSTLITKLFFRTFEYSVQGFNTMFREELNKPIVKNCDSWMIIVFKSN